MEDLIMNNIKSNNETGCSICFKLFIKKKIFRTTRKMDLSNLLHTISYLVQLTWKLKPYALFKKDLHVLNTFSVSNYT